MVDYDEHPIRLGAARVDITPAPGCYLAGFGRPRVAESVHDPLWARAVAVTVGRQRAALVAVDCLGLTAATVAAIAGRLDLRAGQLLVCATHTHSGPDTLGLWGPDDLTSGVDPAVIERLADGVVAAVEQAFDAAQEVLLTCSRAAQPRRSAVNARACNSLDSDLAVLHAGAAVNGRGVATVVNWACHPEVLSSRSTALSSDFAEPLRRRLEESLGGTALFVNGALGAMVTPAAADNTFAEAERIGRQVADAGLAALRESEEVIDSAALRCASRAVRVPVHNERFAAAMAAGVLPRELDEQGCLTTTVAAWRLGPVTFLAVPGEAMPELGRRWKRMMSSRHRFLLGLANDELGYLLREEDFTDPTYAYEQTMSCGPATAGLLSDAVQRVLAAVDG